MPFRDPFPSLPKFVQPSRGQNQLVLENLGRVGSGSLGPQCGQNRLLNQVLAPSSAIHSSNGAVRFVKPSQGHRVSETFKEGSHRNPGRPDLSRVLLETIFGPQSQQLVETSYRSQPSERLFKFQDSSWTLLKMSCPH